MADAIGLPLDSVEASGELAMASHDTMIAAGTIDAGNVAAQRITISGIRADRPLIRFRDTWFCTTDLDPAWEVRETGWHVSLDGDAPLEVTLRMAVPLDRMAAVSPAYTAPTERSTRCHMSAQPPRASSHDGPSPDRRVVGKRSGFF